jgi:hypothetical protein
MTLGCSRSALLSAELAGNAFIIQVHPCSRSEVRDRTTSSAIWAASAAASSVRTGHHSPTMWRTPACILGHHLLLAQLSWASLHLGDAGLLAFFRPFAGLIHTPRRGSERDLLVSARAALRMDSTGGGARVQWLGLYGAGLWLFFAWNSALIAMPKGWNPWTWGLSALALGPQSSSWLASCRPGHPCRSGLTTQRWLSAHRGLGAESSARLWRFAECLPSASDPPKASI